MEQSTTWKPNPANTYAPEALSEKQEKKLRVPKTFAIEKQKRLECGHKLDTNTPPTSKCSLCWISYFDIDHEKTVSDVKKVLSGVDGRREVKAKHGDKYVLMLERFLMIVSVVKKAKDKQEREENQEREPIEDGN